MINVKKGEIKIKNFYFYGRGQIHHFCWNNDADVEHTYRFIIWNIMLKISIRIIAPIFNLFNSNLRDNMVIIFISIR